MRTTASAATILMLSAAFASAAAAAVDPAQELAIQKITSVFENGTPDFQYGYIEDIGDGAGITCGRVGFTGGELQLLVGRYVEKVPDAPLARYLPCLRKMGDAIMKDYSCLYPSLTPEQLEADSFKKEGGLVGEADFGAAWTAAAADPVMRRVQDDYEDGTYFRPALKLAGDLGLSTALGAAFVYDACVQMGCDSALFQNVAKQFAAAHGGRSSPNGVDEEAAWMALYVPERKAELSVTPPGSETVERVTALGEILAAKNFRLAPPVVFDYFGERFALSPIESRAFVAAARPRVSPPAANRSALLRLRRKD